MEKQLTAPELADLLDAAPYTSACTNASAEKLRRLHSECEDWRQSYALLFKDNAELRKLNEQLLAALEAAVDCGMVPLTSAKEGGAAKHSIQVRVADQIRAAITTASAESTLKESK